MTEEQFEAIKDAFAALKSASKPYKFVYINKGEDGKPFVAVQRKLTLQQALAMKQKAVGNQLAYGDAVLTEDRKGISFHPTEEPPARFGKDLREKLGPQLPLLKKSRVAPIEETATVAKVTVDTEEAEERKREEERKVSVESRDLKRGEDQSIIVVEKGLDSEQKLVAIQKRMDEIERLALKHQERRNELETEIGNLGWFSGKTKEAKRKEQKEEGRKIDELLREFARQAEAAKLAKQDIIKAHRLSGSYLSANDRMHQAQLGVAKAEADIAHAKAMKAEQDLDEAETVLQVEIGFLEDSHPELHRTRLEAVEADRVADEALATLLKLSNALGRLEEQLEDLEDQDGEDAKLLKAQIAEAKRKVEEADKQAAALSFKAQIAHFNFDEEVRAVALDNEALAQALKDLDAAKAKRIEAAEGEDEADETLERAELEADNAALFTNPDFALNLGSLFEDFVAAVPIKNAYETFRFDFTNSRVAMIQDDITGWCRFNPDPMTVVRKHGPYKEALGGNAGEKFVAAYATKHYMETLAEEFGIDLEGDDSQLMKDAIDNGYVIGDDVGTVADFIINLGELQRRKQFDVTETAFIKTWIETAFDTHMRISVLDRKNGVLVNIPELGTLIEKMPYAIGGLRAVRSERQVSQTCWKNMMRGMNAIQQQGYMNLSKGLDHYKEYVQEKELPEFEYVVTGDPTVVKWVKLLGKYAQKTQDLSQRESQDITLVHLPALMDEFRRTQPQDKSKPSLAEWYDDLAKAEKVGATGFLHYVAMRRADILNGSCAHENTKIVLQLISKKVELSKE